MGSTSMSNPNPWSPYDSYNDCSQGICNIYCPQWCYFIFPPPPPPSYENTSSSNFSPLLIALIGVLVSAFILISYYTLISKYCHRHNSSSSFSSESPGVGFFSSERRQGDGLNESVIKSITVYKYRKGDGFVDCSDCSVCLSEFEENESLRLLPKCNHAFHLPCIDTWLKSHSNCPLCRAFVTTTEVDRGKGTTEIISSSIVVNRTGDSVVDLEMEPRNMQPIRRSVSLNSSGLVVSVSDVLREIQADGAGTSCNERSGVSSFLVKSSVTMKKSFSTGRFIFSRSSDRGGRNDGLPI